MTYSEAEQLAKHGKVLMLPNYTGYFKWDYGKNKLIFINNDYVKDQLDEELKRTDWYYII